MDSISREICSATPAGSIDKNGIGKTGLSLRIATLGQLFDFRSWLGSMHHFIGIAAARFRA